MPQVLRTSEAERDLVGIHSYISEHNATAADRVVDAIEQKCQLLAQLPEMGRSREELAPNLRSFPVGKYVVFYRPIEAGIEVIRVLHGARDIDSIF